jgi:hypothetical protein
MVITGAAVRVPARCRSLPRFALKQQLATMCERFAGQGAVDFRVSFRPGWQRFGVPACQIGLVAPVDRGEIDIVAQLHGVGSVMHEDRKQQNDRSGMPINQSNAPFPKPIAASMCRSTAGETRPGSFGSWRGNADVLLSGFRKPAMGGGRLTASRSFGF